MLKLKTLLLGLFVFTITFATAQKNITVEDIWRDYKFVAKSVPGFNFLKDGKHYTRLQSNMVQKYDLTTGDLVEPVFEASEVENMDGFNGRFDDYSFSLDEQKMLIQTQTRQIYRRSVEAFYYVYDRSDKELTAVDPEAKQRFTSFNPEANMVAYLKGNDLYYKNLENNKISRITTDGKINHIINGGSDWVYEEEFSITKTFQWSPDSKNIAFIRFDESAVPEFTMTLHNDDAYPEYQTFKYPKVGEVNAKVSVHIYNLESGKIKKVDIGDDKDIYIPRIFWTKDPNKLCIFKMNRHQNELELILADANTGKTSLMLKETNKYYIDITDHLTFLKDGEHFIWTSEQDGYNHIYLYEMNGKLKKQLTEGNYDVTTFYGVDEEDGLVYFQAAMKSPMQREIYSVNLKGKKLKQLSKEDGWNSAQFSSTFDYYVLDYSNVNAPSTYTVYDISGKPVREIEDNAQMKEIQEEYGWQPFEFFSFKTSEEVELNGWMLKPADFNPNREYPVLMYVYGGPGSQTVEDTWGGFNSWWYQMLAQQGYIVVSVDNRGTGGRGEAFKKMTYQQLGKYETVDQIEAAKWLGSQSYIDASRIGIWGWSYGGYMSSLCILKGNEVFKTAIAVAPVTNWKWYDTIYTERYMRTDDENPDGYKDNSPVYFADRLKGKYLIVHGMADDNVHFQNTTEMVNALVLANKQFDTYFYPNRNHGIYGGPTRLHLYNKMTKFVLENL